jgi:hypothetical protein
MMGRLRIEGSYGIDLIQQPDSDDAPIVVAAPALPQDTPRPEVPVDAELGGEAGRLSVGIVGEAGRLSVCAGPGTTNIGLIPKLLISVEPSGTPTLLDDGPTATDGVADAPEDELPEAVEPQALDIVEGMVIGDPDIAPLMPPPSNEEIDPELPELDVPTDPAIPEPAIPTPEHAALPMEPSGMGLRPPGLSSTAPIGTPTGPAEAGEEPKSPRGEVIPIAGEAAVPTCARLAPLRKSAAIVTAINRRVTVSLFCFRIGAHHSFACLEGPLGLPRTNVS